MSDYDKLWHLLAHTDLGSLPNDWTLLQIAEARIDDMLKLRDQVRDTCKRAEAAEAERDRLREALTAIMSNHETVCAGIVRLEAERNRLREALLAAAELVDACSRKVHISKKWSNAVRAQIEAALTKEETT
jgi:seryl-tRNA synthetase